MEVNCAGCAGCCLDWRPLLEDPDAVEHERRGPRNPLDDVYNLVPLEREEVRAFVDAGYGDALTPRLWEADAADDAIEIDGYRVAAIAGRPAFFIGLRKSPKPVAPFALEEPQWLPTCVFLDPETLQCRIHEDDLYPAECVEYPAHNLALEVETECERVERTFGGNRLVDGETDDSETSGLLLGPGAVGQKVFTHPEPARLEGRIDRLAVDELTPADRAEFVAVAAASSPGTTAVSERHYDRARVQTLEADSWVGRAIHEWNRRADSGDSPTDDHDRQRLEEGYGAPPTPGWDEDEEATRERNAETLESDEPSGTD